MYALYQYRNAYDHFIAGIAADVGLCAAVDQRLDRLALLGPRAGPKVTEHLRDGIFACRAQRKRQQARLLYFYLKGMRIVVAVGVVKEKKVPPSAIDHALAIKKAIEENPELANEITPIH